MLTFDQTQNISDDFARAACLARQIQTLALGARAGDTETLDAIEAIAEAMAYRLEVQAGAMESPQGIL